MATVLKVSDAASLAMHTMVLLALKPDRVVSTHEIASCLQVSEAHLSKVLQRLTREGLVKSVRGPRGGFKLGKTHRDLTLLDVYEAIEGRLESSECLLESRSCAGDKCILGFLLQSVNRQVRDYLTGTRLSELTDVYRRKDHAEQVNHPN